MDLAQLSGDPFEQFHRWFADARAAGQPEPEAAALATSTRDGRPSVRFVLVRGVDTRGFVFYTNGRSRKGREMAATGWAALAFRWAATDRQVRVSGRVGEVRPAEADAYFAGRARGSQVGAWASDQSEPLVDRAELDRQVAVVEARFAGKPVSRPPWWAGFRIDPDEMEFWQQGESRLHDRFLYTRDGRAASGWTLGRLNP